MAETSTLYSNFKMLDGVTFFSNYPLATIQEFVKTRCLSFFLEQTCTYVQEENDCELKCFIALFSQTLFCELKIQFFEEGHRRSITITPLSGHKQLFDSFFESLNSALSNTMEPDSFKFLMVSRHTPESSDASLNCKRAESLCIRSMDALTKANVSNDSDYSDLELLLEENAIHELTLLVIDCINNDAFNPCNLDHFNTLLFSIRALDKLAVLQESHWHFILSDVIPLLVSLAIDGNYREMCIREASARIIGYVSSTTPKLEMYVDRTQLLNWLQNVDNIKDDIIKYHVNIATRNMSHLLVPETVELDDITYEDTAPETIEEEDVIPEIRSNVDCTSESIMHYFSCFQFKK
jgi:hypothetical protein